MTESKNLSREITTFMLLTFTLSGIMYYVIIDAGSMGAKGFLYPVLLMWCPGVAALVTSLVYRKSLRGLGWGWGATRYQLTSYLLPLGYVVVAYGAVWLLGLGGIDENFSRPWMRFLLLGTALGCFAALGEEIGWRGFLVDRLSQITGFTNTSLISGFVWALWHSPLILFVDYNSGTPTWYGLLCFTVMAVSVSFAYAWLRLKSGSLWTAMFLHASHNFWLQSVFNPLTTDTGNTEYFIGEFGIAVTLVTVLIAYLYWCRRGEVEGDALKRSPHPPAG